jgi:hypothetical protein
MATHPEKPAYYPHTLPEHGSEIINEGKWQPSKELEVVKPGKRRGVVYERRRSGGKERDEQPERLITVQDAIDTLNLPPSTVWHWFTSGRLKERGRVWLAKPGGRGTPLVSEAEVHSLINERSPKGRLPQRRKGYRSQK